MCCGGKRFIPTLTTTTIRRTGCPKAFQYNCILYETKKVSAEMFSGVFVTYERDE
jgi:hypothetical protein